MGRFSTSPLSRRISTTEFKSPARNTSVHGFAWAFDRESHPHAGRPRPMHGRLLCCLHPPHRSSGRNPDTTRPIFPLSCLAPLASLLLVYPNAHGSHHTSAVHHGGRQPRIPSTVQHPTRRPRFHDCGLVPRGQGLAYPIGLPPRPTTSTLHGYMSRLSVPHVG